jgi:hypothetical protein
MLIYHVEVIPSRKICPIGDDFLTGFDTFKLALTVVKIRPLTHTLSY